METESKTVRSKVMRFGYIRVSERVKARGNVGYFELQEIRVRRSAAKVNHHGIIIVAARPRPTAYEKSAQRYDLVLMDVMMPVMDGLEATRELRRREKAASLPPIPIVAMTAGALEEDRQHCFEAGMDGYLAKPVHPTDLVQALKTWLPEPEHAESARTPGTQPTMQLPSQPSCGLG
ncbi:MAG: response regulator [Desulfovibrionales bacterium]|nr:MAG: response regulator [Desulfovibrionales bacterium]